MRYHVKEWMKISLATAILALLIHYSAYSNESNKNPIPIEIVADSLTVKQTQSLAFFSGNVIATQGDYKLKSDKMTIHYKNSGTEQNAPDAANLGSNEISKINVDGNVLLTTPLESAKGNKGEFDIEKGIITLTGNVVFIKGDNLIKGNNLVHDLQSGDTEIRNVAKGSNSSTKQRVTGIFIPKNDIGNTFKQQ